MCVQCNELQHTLKRFGGAVTVTVAAVTVAVLVTIATVTWWQREILAKIRAEVRTNLRIGLGLLQVLSLLKSVLDIVFPPTFGVPLSYAGVATADLRIFVSLDCYGWDWCGGDRAMKQSTRDTRPSDSGGLCGLCPVIRKRILAAGMPAGFSKSPGSRPPA
jgi:hypothetical protein